MYPAEIDRKISRDSLGVTDAEKRDGEEGPDFKVLKSFCERLIEIAGRLENFNKTDLQSGLDKENLESLLTLIMPLAEKCYALRDKKAVPSNGNAIILAFSKKFSDAPTSVDGLEPITDLGRVITSPNERLDTNDELHAHLRTVVPSLFKAAVSLSKIESQVLLARFFLPNLAMFAGLNADSTKADCDALKALLKMMHTLACNCQRGKHQDKRSEQPTQSASQALRGDGNQCLVSAAATAVASPMVANGSGISKAVEIAAMRHRRSTM